MKYIRSVTLFVLLCAVLMLHIISARSQAQGSQVDSSSEYEWTQLSAAADFQKSYNFQLFADKTFIRAFHHDGVWVSNNGKMWLRTGLANIIKGQAFLDYIRFKGAIYALGTFDGNIEHYTQTTQIARTADFKHWKILAKKSNLPSRYFYHPVVFQGKIWIFGGEDARGKYDDAWVSSDAVHWKKVAENLPFGKRAGQRFVVFKDRLYMLDHDAWVSYDGIHWKILTDKIAEGNIFGFAAEVFDGQIWLIGCNRDGKFRSEVLHSWDGVNWIAERAPWTPRGGVASCVFKNKIIMTGGKYGGPGIDNQTEFVYSNDVWSLGKE